jgi:hypothetical protein
MSNPQNRSLSTTTSSAGSLIAQRIAAQRSAQQPASPTPSTLEGDAEDPVQAAPPAPVPQDPNAALLAELAALRAQNASLRAAATSGHSSKSAALAVKISERKANDKGKMVGGGVSVYGTGRFPVTAYGFNAIRLYSEENCKNVFGLMAREFNRLSFKTTEQRDATAAALRSKGLMVSDEAIAAAIIDGVSEE